MARSIELSPYMNFRFGVRHDERSPWLGFTAVDIIPGVNGKKGVLHLKKHLGPDFVDFLCRVGDRLNIGVFHVDEEIACDSPQFQINLYGLSRAEMELGNISLDAMGGPPETQVLQTDVVLTFERMEMRNRGSSFVMGAARQPSAASRLQRVVKATSPVIM